ncbi:MAG: response regulator [Acidobacteriota bacterium]|nr:response regulator [Blastocatellia bacterium]MDW8413321.1 response regulator [Acidobacteriota bacterium]
MSGKPKLLVVDDQPFIVGIFDELLRDEPVDLYTACNGEEALQIAQQQLPDIIFLDIEMPRLDGISVIKKLREDSRFASTMIFMLSAKGDLPSPEQQRELRVSGYLTKPFSPMQLYNLIRDHLNLSA